MATGKVIFDSTHSRSTVTLLYARRQEPVSRSPCALLKLDDLTSKCICCMHLSAKLRKSSFSKAQGLRETGSCWTHERSIVATRPIATPS